MGTELETKEGEDSVACNGLKAPIDYRVSLSKSGHSAAKRMRCKVGVGKIVKFANDSFPAGVRSLTILPSLASCITLGSVQLTDAMLLF
jgi:hypothetical protein